MKPFAAALAASFLCLASFARADAADDMKNPEKVQKNSRIAVEKSPEDSGSWFNLGLASYKLGQHAEAEKAFAKAAALNAESANYRFWQASTASKLGKPAEAVTFLKQALEIDGEMVEAKTNLAQAYFDAGKYDDAIEMYQAALDPAPADPSKYYNQIGVAYLKKGDPTSATKWFEKSIAKAPNDPNMRFNLGQMYRKMAEDGEQSMWPRAAAEFVKVVEMSPSDVKAMFFAAETLLVSGKTAEGKAMLERYLKADPGGKKSGTEIHEYALELKKDVDAK